MMKPEKVWFSQTHCGRTRTCKLSAALLITLIYARIYVVLIIHDHFRMRKMEARSTKCNFFMPVFMNAFSTTCHSFGFKVSKHHLTFKEKSCIVRGTNKYPKIIRAFNKLTHSAQLLYAVKCKWVLIFKNSFQTAFIGIRKKVVVSVIDG